MGSPMGARTAASSATPFLALLGLTASCGPSAPEGPLERSVYLLNLGPERVAAEGFEHLDLRRRESPAFEVLDLGIGFDVRRALLQARGTELVFRSTLAPAATLRFDVGFGQRPEGPRPPPDEEPRPFELEVLARPEGGEEIVLWSATLTPPAEETSSAWQSVECALPFERGDLVFRTRGSVETAPAFKAPGFAAPRVCTTVPRAPVANPPRNVVVFLMDTLRADHVGPMGHEADTTPALDEIARDALVFTQASSAAPWTKASVASLMTSRLPSRHGAEGYPDRLRESEVTLARLFRQAGYRTCAVGFNTWIFNSSFNLASGFEDVFEVFDQSREGGARAEAVVAEALDWIHREPSKPFFLYVHLIDPHEPYVPDAEYRARFVAPYSGKLTGRLEGPGRHTALLRKEVSPADLDFLRQLYDAEIAFADHMLGELVTQLEGLGLWNETTLVFTSDHGEEFLDHGAWSHGSTLYQEQLHVPLVLKVPASAGVEARRCELPVSLLDVAPTLCELARIPVTGARFTGKSLLAACAGDAPGALVLAELHKEGQHKVSVREGNTKYIRTLAPEPREELFDLGRDPGEQTNLAPTAPPVRLEALRAFVAEHLAAVPRDGLYFEFLGDGSAANLRVIVRGSEARLGQDVSDAERGSDELFTRPGERGPLSARFTLGEQDRRDVLLLDPAPGTVLEFEIRLDGKRLDPGRVLLGPAEAPAPTPQRIVADDPSLLVVDEMPSWNPRPGVWLRIWQIREGEAVEFDEATAESLRALGYVK